MKFNRYIYETSNNDEAGFYNSLSTEFLSFSSPKEEFSKKYFLEGQENDALREAFNETKNAIAFTIIPGWECNLRCKHCVVLDKLKLPKKNEDRVRIDHIKIVNFVEEYRKYYNCDVLSLTFVGGEPLLYLDDIVVFSKLAPKARIHMTTNLAMNIDDEMLEKMHLFTSIAVSIDGPENSHNKQRIPLYKTESVFDDVIENLKKIIKNGMIEKINVQAALSDEEDNEENRMELYEILLSLGIKFERIKMGCLHPTKMKPTPTKNFLESLSCGNITTKMCCKYRKNNFVIDGDKVYSDYYDLIELGCIDDSPEEINKNHFEKCISNMPVLNDDNCKKCPVLGFCWGGCSNGSILINEKPSKFCNQEALINRVLLYSKRNELLMSK